MNATETKIHNALCNAEKRFTRRLATFDTHRFPFKFFAPMAAGDLAYAKAYKMMWESAKTLEKIDDMFYRLANEIE